jgi:hypothetical protein
LIDQLLMAAWLSDVPDDHASCAGSFVAVMASPSDRNPAMKLIYY